MSKTYCGVDCGQCPYKENCNTCTATGGKPFGSSCLVAECCKSKGFDMCTSCSGGVCGLRGKLIEEFLSLGIPGLDKIDTLYSLKGSYVNLQYRLGGGQSFKLLDDNKIYLGTQTEKADGRCYGLVGDEKYLLVCEYSQNGADAEIIVLKKRDYK